jgi:hypothetical protein
LNSMLGLLGGEYFTRMRYPKFIPATNNTSFFQYDPIIGFVNRPNVSGVIKGVDFSVHVNINRHGLRGKDYPFEKSDSTAYRIVFLGDSFTWGHGVEESARFTDLIERNIPHLEIVNISCPSYGQVQELLRLKREGFEYKPDLVLVMIDFQTDFTNNVDPFRHGYFAPYVVMEDGKLVYKNIPVPVGGVSHWINRELSKRSALWVLLSQIQVSGRGTFGQILFFPKNTPDCVSGESPSIVQGKSVKQKIMVSLLLDMQRQARSHGADFGVIIAPGINADKNSVEDDLEYNSTIKAIKNEHILLFDLKPVFENFFLSHSGEMLTFRNDFHWNQNGHKVVANAVTKFLIDTFHLFGS